MRRWCGSVVPGVTSDNQLGESFKSVRNEAIRAIERVINSDCTVRTALRAITTFYEIMAHDTRLLRLAPGALRIDEEQARQNLSFGGFSAWQSSQ